MPLWHAVYIPDPGYITNNKDLPDSSAPLYDDPLTRHQLSYLNGGGGSGKTTRAIEIFRDKNPLVFTPDLSPGQRDAGKGRPGPDLSQLLPLEWPDRLDTRKDGTEFQFPRFHRGSIVSWLLSTLEKAASWLADTLWALVIGVGALLLVATRD